MCVVFGSGTVVSECIRCIISEMAKVIVQTVQEMQKIPETRDILILWSFVLSILSCLIIYASHFFFCSTPPIPLSLSSNLHYIWNLWNGLLVFPFHLSDLSCRVSQSSNQVRSVYLSAYVSLHNDGLSANVLKKIPLTVYLFCSHTRQVLPDLTDPWNIERFSGFWSTGVIYSKIYESKFLWLLHRHQIFKSCLRYCRLWTWGCIYSWARHIPEYKKYRANTFWSDRVFRCK